MRKAHLLALAATAVVLPLTIGPIAGCSAAVDTHVMTATDVRFELYRSFAFETTTATPDLYAASPRTEEVRDEIRRKAADLLSSRGYLATSAADADLIVRVEAGRRDHKSNARTVRPAQMQSDGVQPEQVQSESAGWLDNEEQDLVEGAFVIDVFDSRTKQLLWHGSARSVIDPNRVERERLERAVEKVLDSFPARIEK